MKKTLAIVICLVFILSLIGCGKKSFEIVGADKLTVLSGTTGESIEITNTDDIKFITDNINAQNYSKGGKVHSSGWSYALQWFDRDGKMIDSLTLLDGYTVIYDGYYYEGMTIDYEIDFAFLDSQFAK